MSRGSIAGLLERNAKACEEARRPECRCRCGGALHGSAHSKAWVEEQVTAIIAEGEGAAEALSLFGDAELEQLATLEERARAVRAALDDLKTRVTTELER